MGLGPSDRLLMEIPVAMTMRDVLQSEINAAFAEFREKYL